MSNQDNQSWEPPSWEPPSWEPPAGPGDFPDPSVPQSPFPPPAQPPNYPPPASGSGFPPPAAPPYSVPPPNPYGSPGPSGYQTPPQKKRRIWPWLLLGIPVLFALLIGGCAFLVFSFTKGPVDATNAYVAELDNGNFETAYDSLCSSVQTSISRDEWVGIARSELGGEITGYNFSQVSIVNDDATVTGSIEVDGLTRTVEFDLVQERDDWRVCSLSPIG